MLITQFVWVLSENYVKSLFFCEQLLLRSKYLHRLSPYNSQQSADWIRPLSTEQITIFLKIRWVVIAAVDEIIWSSDHALLFYRKCSFANMKTKMFY